MAPLKKRVVDKLLEGKYVHISELLRQRARSADPQADKRTETVGAFKISVRDESTKRRVSTSNDWVEAFTTSVLPAQIERLRVSIGKLPVSGSTSEVEQQLEQLRASSVYLVFALANFNRGLGTAAMIDYLEQHRRNCFNGGLNIAEPNQAMMYNVVHAKMTSASSAAASPGSSGSYSSSSSGSSSSSSTAPAAAKRLEACGLFNKDGKCSYGAKCRFPHTCTKCKQPGHGKYACPQKDDKPAAGKKSS